MRWLSSVLAALSASFATWYAVDQRRLEELRRLPSLPPDSCDSCLELQRLVEQQVARILELEGAGEPTGDLIGRSFSLLQDLGSHSVEEGLALLGLDQSPEFNHYRSLLWNATEVIHAEAARRLEGLQPVVLMAGQKCSELYGQLPPEVTQPVLGGVQAAKELVEQMLWQSNSRLQEGLSRFLDRHPQHRPSLTGVPPALVFGVLALGLLESLMWLRSLLLCFGCCRRRKPRGQGQGGREKEKSEKSEKEKK
ncbi:hypothetical protein AK812_SmicGene33696 [Symbiodinium microadriaticum]|uniref:Uncharacterized protein n=1 Tax=Symbiodinium microadriaticum TaxID=2951 RepID=A0A1Q9CQW9_SYMMI|nr:hypothetical protein AK812_SmicGene33696 [Symbiodinium microadriaticum]CAE7264801.1 unnamed protein product [Symbiodinium microadriaticum]